eukprot:scaffold10020_cov122-Isochrysis_galbana.AAC.6
MKHAVRVLTVTWSRGVSSAPSAYSSGRGKLSRRGPLYPPPHLVGGEGSMLSGATSRASPMVSSPRDVHPVGCDLDEFGVAPGGWSGFLLVFVGGKGAMVVSQ